ncbi:MAG: hypothetical protein NC124_08710 [Clostridium sp.]|nr:hypothetical protein [Clostridium sp.]
MQETLLSYETIVQYFGKETIEDRYKFLFDKMQEYINERELQGSLFISEEILQQVVMDYFADVYRLKEFHKIKNINITKIVAYEVYWILRRKPLQVSCVKGMAQNVFANEGFATTFIAHECLVPEEKEPLAKSKEEEFLTYLRHINYHLKYRCLDKQCLEAMLYSFEIGKYIA